MKKTLIIIPSRMESKRFPGKPLIKIKGKSMLLHVWDKAIKAKVGDVVVACCDDIVKQELKNNNINFVMTKKNHKSGTDRVYEAYKKLSKFKKYDIVINLQGDLPDIKPESIRTLKNIITNSKNDMATLVTKIKNTKDIKDINIVKTVLSKDASKKLNAIYFSRLPIPMNSKKYYEHVGIYAYTDKGLKKFVKLKKNGLLENAENLEQLRALENNIKIDVSIVKSAPLSIDTPKDLKNFKKKYKLNEK